MAEAPPIVTIAGTGSFMAPAVTDNQSMASPATSEGTVVALGMHSPPLEGTPERGTLPVAGQGQALFSTDLGRLRPRAAIPPYTPVVVRSNMARDVVAFARSLFNKFSWQYVCYFPNCGYDISDLFDREDIHTFEPAFCKEVLNYITFDNVCRVRVYALEWSLQNRDRLNVVAGGIYDEEDPLSVVAKVFVKDEAKYHPPHFLWHVANFIRSGMYNTVKKIQETSKAVDAGEVKVASSDTGKIDLRPNPMAEVKLKVAEASRQPHPLPPPGAGSQMLHQPPMPLPYSFGLMPFQVPTQPFVHQGAMQVPRMGYPQQFLNVPMGGPAPVNSPHMVPPILMNPKNRNARQGSGSFRRFTPHAPWAENTLPMHPPGPQFRQPSGMMPTMQSPHIHAPALTGQQMMDPINIMAPPPPPNTNFMSPPMPHGQIVQPPMPYGPGMMAHQSGSYGPPFMEPGPPICQDSAGPIEFQTEDLSNNWRYPLNGNNQRMDQGAILPRRSSKAGKQLGLYNPYGNDRPDWSSVPPQSNSRRGPRTSFSNPQGRGRRSSMAGQNRPSTGYCEPGRGEYNASHIGGRIELAHPSSSSNPQTSNIWKRVPNIINDVEYGCDENWIGPKNKSVTELIVFEIPDIREDSDQKVLASKVQDHFERNAGISVHRVQTKIDKRDTSIARVFFHSPADAAKGLRLNDSVLEGKKISVKVPFHCYCINPSQAQTQSSRVASTTEHRSPFQGQQGRRRMSHAQPGIISIIGGKGKQKTTYSPQDARSDLPQPHQTIQNKPIEVTGSPENYMFKKQDKPSAKKDKSKAPSEASHEQNTPFQLLTSVAPRNKNAQDSTIAGTEEVTSMDTHRKARVRTKKEGFTIYTKVKDSELNEDTATARRERHEHDTEKVESFKDKTSTPTNDKKAGHIKIAVPNLKILVAKSATSSKAPSNNSSPTETLAITSKEISQTESVNDLNTLDALTIPYGKNPEGVQNIQGGSQMNTLGEDTVSTAASVTMQASPGQTSSSPTAGDFHTPLQTPSGLAPQQETQPKKAMKKGGKKYKKDVPAPLAQSADEEPFAEQLKQVEGLTSLPHHSPSSSMSYYQTRESIITGSAIANDTADDTSSDEVKTVDDKVNKSPSNFLALRGSS